MDAATLGDNLARVRERVAAAARRAGRRAEDVALLAVSKGQPASALRAAMVAGQRLFGENYAQELEEKARELAAEAEPPIFHFIGRLQRNKVSKVLAHARVVHAVDRAELAKEIARRASPDKARVFIEVNVGAEASKGGCSPEDLEGLIAVVRAEPALELAGLMTIPPDVATPDLARPFFARLRELRDRHGGAALLPELSMGMSHDFEIAIEEGATIVRVGTAIFGARGPRT